MIRYDRRMVAEDGNADIETHPGAAAEDAGKLACFEYVTAEKAGLYRAIMRLFVEAKAQFKLHLRPGQIADAPTVAAPPWRADRVETERALQQLCEWGNLEKHLDTVDVNSVEEFLRPRFLYQITDTGQAVERALRVFEEVLGESGELQTTALHEIRDELNALLDLAGRPAIDEAEAFRCLDILRARFERLTARAQTFLSSLQRTTQLQGVVLHDFMSYKQVLIDYLERFIAELTVTAPDIARTIRSIEDAGIERVLDAAAKRERRDALLGVGEAEHAAAVDAWRRRWQGLRGWFMAADGEPSQAQELRNHARAAIPALLRAVVLLHERRVTHSDRSADLRVLARWFAQADDDRAAHRLWRAAFGLSPARHLRIDQDTLDAWEAQPPAASTSWFDAVPLRVSPRLRKTGRTARPGAPAQVIDRRQEKAAIAHFAAEQARQLAAARAALATGRATRLSRLGELDTPAFDLFLDLLGEALARKTGRGGPVESVSADGTLFIRMEPTGDGVIAAVRTPAGRFVGEDHHILIAEERDEVPQRSWTPEADAVPQGADA